jgi:flavodoxin
MSTLILYYSYTGNTRIKALALAQKESYDIAEIIDKKRPAKVLAYLAGCVRSMRGSATPIKSLGVDLEKYDHIVLMSPVWAGGAPPAVNSALELLPKGKLVTVTMVSAGGKSSCHDRIATVIEQKGSTLESFADVVGK